MINIRISTLSQISAEDLGQALAAGKPDEFARMLRAFFDAAYSSRAEKHISEFAEACTHYALPDYIGKFDRLVAHHEFKAKEKS